MYRRDVSFYATFILVVIIHVALVAWILFFGLTQCQVSLKAGASAQGSANSVSELAEEKPYRLNLNLADRAQQDPEPTLTLTINDDPESRLVLPTPPKASEPTPKMAEMPKPKKETPTVVNKLESKPKIIPPTPKPKIAEKPKPTPKKEAPKVVQKPKPKPTPKKEAPKVVQKPKPKPAPKKPERKVEPKPKPAAKKPEVKVAKKVPEPKPEPPIVKKATPKTSPPEAPVKKAQVVAAKPVTPRLVDDGNTSDARIVPAKPSNGQGTTSKTAIVDMRAYRKSIEQVVTQRLRVPKGVSVNAQPEVLVKIGRSGKIVYARLSHSSGNSLIDRAAIDAVRIGSKLLGLPTGYQKDTYEVPIKFQID